MMRFRMLLGALLAAAGLTLACWHMNADGENQPGEAVLAAWEANMGEETPDMRRMQENLALWYNHGLTTGEDPENLADAYDGILDYGGGMMGILELPESDIRIPIYHGDSGNQTGLLHDPGTPFPLGTMGIHTLLMGCQVDISLEEGDLFWIHILDQMIPYRVQQVIRGDECPAPPEADADAALCTLVLEIDGYWLLICGSRVD